MRPLRLAFTTLGCKVNRFDGEALLARLRDHAEVVPFEEEADLYVVNSCTVTAVADRQTRQLLHRARRRNPDARVVLTGCLAATDASGARLGAEVDRIFAQSEHDGLVAYVVGLAAARQPPSPSSTIPGTVRARPFLKIQDGCDHACTFCIVPRARGASRSCLAPAEVRAALQALGERGFHEVVLTGIHLGQYGRDLDPPTSLAALLGACLGAVERLRLSSIEPQEIDPELVELMASEIGICHHLHVPIQSGSDSILEQMNRPYRQEEVRGLLDHLRSCLPAAALGTDLITGFPGETERDFEHTLELVQSSPLTHLHVFPYSPRPGTPAEQLWRREPVQHEVVRERAARLRRAGLAKLLAFAEGQLDQSRPVLIERRDRQGLLAGVSDNYLRVTLDGQGRESDAIIGRVVPVRLERVREEDGRVTGRA
jgi:threonylcarbamoyladenosine tRNA methylthiotransferase MtaB